MSFYASPEHASALPLTGAVEAVHRLAEKNEICIVTGRPEDAEAYTLHWLSYHFGDELPVIHFTNHASMDHSKYRLAKRRDTAAT